MPFEHRPDGSLKLAMHQPLYQVVIVLLVAFGIGGMFVFGLATNQAAQIVVRGHDTGFNLPVMAWRILFLAGAVVALGAGFFILFGLLRGGNPHVRLESRRIVVAGRSMAGDRAMRWDEVEKISQFRIAHGDAITLKSKSGQKLQLSDHVFAKKGDFRVLTAEIRRRVSVAAAENSGAAPG